MNDQRATLPAFSGLGASAGTQSLLGSRDAVGDLTDGGQIINSGREFARLTTSHVRSTRRSGTDSDAKSSQEDCFGVASTVSETDSHNRPHHSRNRSDLSTSVSPTATTSSCTQEVGDRSGHDGEVVDSNATLSPLSRRRGLGVRSNWSLRVRGSQAAGLITRRDVKSPQEATDPVKSAGQSWQISESQTTAEAAQAVVTRNPNGTGNCVGRTSAEVSCQDIHSLPTGPEDDAFFDMILRLQVRLALFCL
ncbi:unnamed protein product [Protopolystoma xenopodis]|uniref:Uncharacterized protein n=1 Tax=Protopolystoma xenopodis TaxID=117903 RepID=A0A448XND6_9PLAT|nr:unnamed protein product [Protopolystoma xenopodis]